MANARGQSVDMTHLSVDQAENRGFLHRDYIAHCMRWTMVANRLQKSGAYKTARVLDVGCGVDLPLAKMLYSSKLIVEQYVGLEYNKAEKLKMQPFHSGKFPIRAFGGVDFADDGDVKLLLPEERLGETPDPQIQVMGTATFLMPNVIVCFEVLEHVEPEHVKRILRKFRRILLAAGPSARAYVSTPCFDPQVGAAGNHVNEMRRDALGSVMESLGLSVLETYGTFASQRDYRDKMFDEYPDMRKVWERLKGFYDSNYMATLFAPMYPANARNNVWVLAADTSPTSGCHTKFRMIEDVPEPWTSSSQWRDLAVKPEEVDD